MNIVDFIAKWKKADLKESSAAQEHFLDLCNVFDHPTPATADPTGCEACHDKAYCAQCHSVNHPATWLQTHGGIAKQGPSACLVCHPQGMCDRCHEQRGVTP